MRQTLRRSQEDWIRRMQKQLDLMNVRVHRAVSDITGVTGMAIVRSIVAGERDPAALAALRDRRCGKNVEEIRRELTGNWREEHLQNLELALASYDHFTDQIARIDRSIHKNLASIRAIREQAGKPVAAAAEPHPSQKKAKRMIKRGEEPMRDALVCTFGIDLTRIEAISVETAACVFMEMGPDIPARFPTEKKFLAYLRLAPQLAISGGHPVHRKGRNPRGGRPPLKRILMLSASTLRSSESALGDYYRRVSFRKGAGVACFATAAKLAQRIYRALKFGIDHAIDGDERWQQAETDRRRARLQRQAFHLGMKLSPIPGSVNA
jgi:hypothetical protein